MDVLVDEKLLEKARRVGKYKTNEQTVTAALEEYVKWLRKRKVEGRPVDDREPGAEGGASCR